MKPNLICPILIGLFALDSQIFPSLLSTLSDDSVEQGLLLTALHFFFPLSAWGSGFLADRYGKPPILVAGCILMSLPFFLGPVVGGMTALNILALSFGVGGGTVEAQSTALLCDVNPGGERRLVSLSQAFYCVGAMAGPFLIAWAHRAFPDLTNTPILVAAGGLTLGGAFLLIPLRRVRGPHAHAPAAAAGLSPSRDLALFTVAVFLYVAVEAGMSGWLAVYGTQYHGMDIGTAPLLLTCFWGGEAAVRFAMSFCRIPFSDRTMLLGSLAGSMLFLAAALTTANATVLFVAVILAAIVMGVFWPTVVGMAGARFRRNSGVAVGAVVGLGGLAASLVQIAIGALSKVPFFGLRGALACLLLLVIANAAIALRLTAKAAA